MNVTILGHSYLALENRKCLTELGNYVNIQVASPSSFKGMIFNYDIKKSKLTGANWMINFYQKLKVPFFPFSVYVLKSKNFNFSNFKPDIIHIEVDPFHPLFMQAILYKFIFLRKAKIICTVKQNTYTSRGFFMDFIKDSIAIFLSKKVDSFIAVNEGVKNIYCQRFGVPLSKIKRCTHMGVDTDLFNLVKKEKNIDKFIIGYCGRIITYKGIWELIDAVSCIAIKSKVELRILGDGPEKKKLLSFAKNLDWLVVMDKVEHNKVPSFLQELDLFVMPSQISNEHVEHDSHAVLEAMSCGIPCIASKSGSNNEVLEDIGLLIDPENIDLLKKTIIKVMADPKFASDLGKLGRDRVINKYSTYSVAKQYYNIYSEKIK
jgi:glycosyltransferase involved in cell wall biosynthesis